jgi:P27 family predicted phage terminase small subunit
MPPELSGNAQSLWHRIIPHLITMKVLAKADQLTLQLMCESYATYIDACDEIEKDGAFIEQVNKAGETYKTEHPACKARSRAWKEIIYLCRQFGMTPSSRTGLNVPSKESGKADPFEALLKGNAN